MAWSICMSADGWGNVTRNLYAMDKDDLITAIVDDDFEAVEESGADIDDIDELVKRLRAEYEDLPQDLLARAALERVRQHNTSDNGGFNVWIDRQGYQTVPVELTEAGELIPLENCC